MCPPRGTLGRPHLSQHSGDSPRLGSLAAGGLVPLANQPYHHVLADALWQRWVPHLASTILAPENKAAERRVVGTLHCDLMAGSGLALPAPS